jgi:SNF2 family DNA or RNA helicase
MGEIIKVFMITSSGAEGINLENTRFVHIMEPYWNPVRIDQVIGRARRICSHKNLPKELQTVRVNIYLSNFSEEQMKSEKNIDIRVNDVSRVDRKTPVSTDEYLLELANTKETITRQILTATKESAMDCSLYNKKDSDEPLVCYNFGKVASNDFSSIPDLTLDATQKATQNIKKEQLKGRKVIIEGREYLLKRGTDELYDMETYDFAGYLLLDKTKKLATIRTMKEN